MVNVKVIEKLQLNKKQRTENREKRTENKEQREKRKEHHLSIRDKKINAKCKSYLETSTKQIHE